MTPHMTKEEIITAGIIGALIYFTFKKPAIPATSASQTSVHGLSWNTPTRSIDPLSDNFRA